MKKMLLVLLASLLGGQVVYGQSLPPIRTGNVVYPLPTSYYGYKPVLLPGSIRTIPVGSWCANVAITSWAINPSNTVITAANNFSVGDTVWVMGIQFAPLWDTMGTPQTVTAASPTQFTIGFTDGSTTTHTETGATARKTAGAACTGNIKWEIIDTGSTAETYNLQTIDGVTDTGFVSHPVITSTTGVVRLTVGPTEGVTSQTGSKAAGTLAIVSTVAFTLRATSVDDPTQTADMPMLVTANGGGYPNGSGGHLQGKAFCNPGFRTVYADRHVPIVCQVFGNVNQMVNTTIESAPVGTNAVLSFATYPQPDFYSGTVQGKYRMKMCPAVDSNPLACAHVTFWVDTSSPPAANSDRVEQVPCPTGAGPSVMGITWDNIYDIGPTQAHHTFLDIPQTYSGNLLVRFHNEGPPGSPSTVHDQVQINPASSGTFSDQKPAVFICGIANSTSGELPVNDANTAVSNPWASQYIVGPYSFFGFAGPSGGSPLPSADLLPWNTLTVANIKFIHATQGYTYTYIGDGQIHDWGEASGPRPSNAIQNFNWIGNRLDEVSDGLFDDCNAQNQGMNHCTLDTFSEGNHLSGYGYPKSYLAHPVYRQSVRLYSMFDLFDGAIHNSEGTLWYSDRGTRSFHMYNRVAVTNPINQASVVGGHSEVQDAFNLLNPDEFYGYQGSASCNTNYSVSLNCLSGWTLDPTQWQAALVEEHNRTEYSIGNAISQPLVNKSFGITMTHNTFSYQPYGGGYPGHEWFPENLSQNFFFAYNTFVVDPSSVSGGAEQLFEDTRIGVDSYEAITTLLQPQYYPEIWAVNNLIPLEKQVGCTYACNIFGVNGHMITHFQTNMFGTIATPAGPFNSAPGAFSNNGFPLNVTQSDWGNIDPITAHISGWTTGNFLTYPTYPVQTPSMAPLNTSAAVGAATTMVGDLAQYPVRYNAADATMKPWTLRVQPGTVGAYDSNGGATPVSIAVAPNPLGSKVVLDSGALVCTTTLSDSSTRNCLSPACTSTNTGSMTISGLNWTATMTPGVGTLNCTAESLTAPGSNFTVIPTPPHRPIDGPFKANGPLKVIVH